MSDRKAFEDAKKQLLQLRGGDLLGKIRMILEEEARGSDQAIDALWTVSEQQAWFAKEVCPGLVASGEAELLDVFMYLLPDLWRHGHDALLKELLGKALRITDEKAHFIVQTAYDDYLANRKVCPAGFPKYLQTF